MIPATHPYIARYKHTSAGPDGQPSTYYTDKPVIAWDEDGYPLVAGKRFLQRADSWTNFHDIAPGESPLVGVIPGGGWLIDCKDDDGTMCTDPVLAWTFAADGTCKPVDVDATGWCDDPTEVSNFARIYHPSRALPGQSPQAPHGALAK